MTDPALNLVHDLHQTNCRLRFCLDRLLPASAKPETPPRAATPGEMTELLSELMRAGAWLRTLPERKDAELEQELADYRSQVERLLALLPSIHSTLLRERARLEQERQRLVSACEWAERSRQTL